MPVLVKGIVIERRLGLSRIKLKSGRRFWAKAPKGIGIMDYVFVAWDYTNDKPAQILTQEQVDNTPTEIGLEDPEVFSDPMSEVFVGDVDVEAEVRSSEFLEPDGCEVDDVEERRPNDDGDVPHHNYFHYH